MRTKSEDLMSDPTLLLEMLKKQIEENLKASSSDIPLMEKRDAFDLADFTEHATFEREIEETGLHVKKLYHNAATPILYEQALKNELGSYITSTGALAVSSGKKTGRSPSDKRVVDQACVKDIWWGKVNMKLSEESYAMLRERAIDYLNTREQLYVVDAFAGWDADYRIKVRVITSRAYHALFMQNMLVMPTHKELAKFGDPDYVIYNAGCFPSNRYVKGVSSGTTVVMNFAKGEQIVLGTEYAGEMKKGILTLMMYAMPLKNQLCLHSSCTTGKDGGVTLFFGLSGTGKTTLSADPNRYLVGDDEHVWTDKGVFNVEGGCYAKAIDLSLETEPDIYKALRFGAVLENVCFNATSREVDYGDISLTENTRASYPLDHINNALKPAIVDRHPTAIVLLCCDAFGVLPPVSRLTPEQVQYYFISGYTAKVAGTEQGITEPVATFSSCFGSPFLVWHPIVYAELLAKKLKEHSVSAYLLNTGWVGGGYGTGKRCPLKFTRKIVDAINDGSLAQTPTVNLPAFNLAVPNSVPGVPAELLLPNKGWSDQKAYDEQLNKLAALFKKNFKEYESRCPQEVLKSGPQ